MGSLQFSVRIPPELDQLVKEYAAKNNTSKSQVMVIALSRYLGYSSKAPLSERVWELEDKVKELQSRLDKLETSAN